MSGRKLVFLDTECTGLGPKRQIWDLALIERTPAGDVERQWFFPLPDLAKADPIALGIGKYYDRHPDPWGNVAPFGTDGVSYWPHHVADIAALLHGALVVGAVPWFDTEALDRTLRRHGALPTWHYHLIDVEAFAAGALGLAPPWSFDKVLDWYGLARGEDRHTALGDARLVRDLYDKVTTGWGTP